MKLKVIGPNQTEVSYPSGVRALFSYNTPVAVYLPGRGFIVTSGKHSRTTTRHIGAWVGSAETSTGTPEEIARLAAGGFYLTPGEGGAK